MPSTLAHAVAVIYLRLSHETFVSDSLEGQEADCVRKAEVLGATEVVIFREVITASKAKVDSANPGWVTLASFLAEQAKEEAKKLLPEVGMPADWRRRTE
ncbi:recombinase family protein [Streptomyces erythrochromogenes]|uniref:recombinase family protein n=1 Tax=Streptomyces erythrochromogenes TaxID=285574 RepID=UPI003697A83C